MVKSATGSGDLRTTLPRRPPRGCENPESLKNSPGKMVFDKDIHFHSEARSAIVFGCTDLGELLLKVAT